MLYKIQRGVYDTTVALRSVVSLVAQKFVTGEALYNTKKEANERPLKMTPTNLRLTQSS